MGVFNRQQPIQRDLLLQVDAAVDDDDDHLIAFRPLQIKPSNGLVWLRCIVAQRDSKLLSVIANLTGQVEIIKA